jgi:predicted nucleic acid-binding protein
MFAEDFEGRVLPFDEAAADHYAEIVTGRRRGGL